MLRKSSSDLITGHYETRRKIDDEPRMVSISGVIRARASFELVAIGIIKFQQEQGLGELIFTRGRGGRERETLEKVRTTYSTDENLD